MKADVKKRWLEALRSGKYRQTQKVLRQILRHAYGDEVYGYCCLGVLCELVAPDVGGTWNQSYFEHHELEEFDSYQVGLPRFVQGNVGVDTASPAIVLPDDHPLLSDPRIAGAVKSNLDRGRPLGEVELASLNDHGFTFVEIADLIEQFVEVTP